MVFDQSTVSDSSVVLYTGKEKEKMARCLFFVINKNPDRLLELGQSYENHPTDLMLGSFSVQSSGRLSQEDTREEMWVARPDRKALL